MKKSVAILSIISSSIAFSQNSETNRQDKSIDINLMPIGLPVVPFPAYGISAGYYLTPNMIVEGELTYTSIDISNRSSSTVNDVETKDTIEADLIVSTYELNLKNFWTNTFYTNSGLGMRSIKVEGTGDYIMDGKVIMNGEDLSFSVNSFVLNLAVGNRWQFSNFTIGCDWFGVMVPISTSTNHSLKSEFKEAGVYDDLDKILNNLGMATTYQFMKFKVGYAF